MCYLCFYGTVIAVTRDRMGRAVTFLSRILKDVANPPVSSARVLGIDEHTALLLDVNTGDVAAVGVGTAYVCSSDHDAAVCESNTNLTFKGMVNSKLLQLRVKCFNAVGLHRYGVYKDQW
jgi:cyanophycinase-like exopeptidase